ncbi:hypothetical protein V3W47_02780 [Deinococcus sp. YIM 134068]|uniref:hypothetical protein n=1 Tax=Deinococcus lichenicola TaxID=3118910 RepID=UPI002F94F593
MMHPTPLAAALLTFTLAVLMLGMVLGLNLGRHYRLYAPVAGTLPRPYPALRLALYALLLGTAALLWLAWVWRVAPPIPPGIRLA